MSRNEERTESNSVEVELGKTVVPEQGSRDGIDVGEGVLGLS